MGIQVTNQHRIAAYQLAIESLPRPAGWSVALRLRGDGSSASGVFAVLDALRMGFQSCVGDLGDGAVSRTGFNWIQDVRVNATHQDRLTAFQLAIDHLPRRGLWERALSFRDDGKSAAGVLEALAEIRTELHACIGDLWNPLRS